MTEIESRFIPHDEQNQYRTAGWHVETLDSHHSDYSVLATRPKPEPQFMHKLCSDGTLTVTIDGKSHVKQLDKRSLSALLADGAQALSLMMRDEI